MILNNSLLVKMTLVLLIAVPVFLFLRADAADFTNRQILLSDSTAGATVSHDISFDVVTPDILGSLVFEYCATSPLDEVPCIPPNGLDVSGAVINNQTGETGFTVHANTTANRLVLTRVPAPSAAQPVSYLLDNVINPSDVGSAYLRIYSHSTDDGTGAHTDRGGLAFATTNSFDVSAYVPPVLTSCVAVTIVGNDCSSTVGSNVDFGELNQSSTASATTQMAVATNGIDGYNITITGTTMTSGNNIISAMSPRTTSQTGVSQFGMNLRANTAPPVGGNLTGVGTGQVNADYNMVNQYKFADGDVVANSPLSTDFNKYTVSYIVNIDGNQPAGYYSTTISYIFLASF